MLLSYISEGFVGCRGVCVHGFLFVCSAWTALLPSGTSVDAACCSPPLLCKSTSGLGLKASQVLGCTVCIQYDGCAFAVKLKLCQKFLSLALLAFKIRFSVHSDKCEVSK